MKLYNYWRSTTSYRVRSALNIKGVSYEKVTVDLLGNGQLEKDYLALNPQGLVPTLVLDDGTVLTQSLAIIEYLDAVYPLCPLLPLDPLARAKVRALAYFIALDIHPINNLRIIRKLSSSYGMTEEQGKNWRRHWIREGFKAVESQISQNSKFAFGDEPDLSDLCIVAECYNARRWGLEIEEFSGISRVESACLSEPAIESAHPDNQPEASLVV